jgi:hypothetical protein
LKKVDSSELTVEERQNPRKKRLNAENTETGAQRAQRKRKSPEKAGALGKVHLRSLPGAGGSAGPKNKNAPTVVGAQFST